MNTPKDDLLLACALDAQLMSFPAKRRVQCSACTWTGRRYEQP